MLPTDKPLDEMELLPIFPENATPAPPVSVGDLDALPPPSGQEFIPLPTCAVRPRVVIADDDEDVIEAVQRSWQTYYSDALDLRVWRPVKPEERDESSGLLETVKRWGKEGWQPDAVVIDMNFDDGGKHGVHYLKELRDKPGCASLIVVLATGNQYCDLEQNKITPKQSDNKTQESPSEWLKKARPLAPEAILYAKSADASFLGRVGVHMDDWKRTARRRAWNRLLVDVSEQLDGRMINLKAIANKIVEFASNELGVDIAVVRRRVANDRYRLLDQHFNDKKEHAEDDEFHIDDAPLLQKMVGESRKPVMREAITISDVDSRHYEWLGYRFIGVSAVLGQRNVGFISLLRKPEHPPFYEAIDGEHLSVLARLLSSALRVSALEERQQAVLDFANRIALSSRFGEVCEALAQTVHNELHDLNNEQSKVTIRLLDFGTGDLKIKGKLGRPAHDEAIHFNHMKSVIAKVVRNNEPVCEGDAIGCDDYMICDPGTKSELCVPLSIGDYALGAVNLEHITHDFYNAYDQAFVSAAATLAANAIERIRTARVLDEMTDFVHRFPRETTETLDSQLRDLLYTFCGYSVLADLERQSGEPSVWRVRHLECKYQDAKAAEAELVKTLNEIYQTQPQASWIGKLFADNVWKNDDAQFSNDEKEFSKINLTPTQAQPTYQKGDAVLWLRHGDDPPHRALLLMWFLPPPMGVNQIEQLGKIAKLFSELDTRKHEHEELFKKTLIGEQAAMIGHVMQHFRHRLGSLTGGQATHINRLENAHRSGNTERFEKALAALRSNSKQIANAFHKSNGYVKKIDLKHVAVSDIVKEAVKYLDGRLENVSLTRNGCEMYSVFTDLEISALVLYSLLENALDIMEGQAERSIHIVALPKYDYVCLQVSDNGPGVAEGIRKCLFEWGTTTKQNGLGSALAFAKTRMELLNGKLDFPLPQPEIGALFEIILPVKEGEPLE